MEEEILFDKWNEQKKFINKASNQGHFYREKEIWWCNLGKNIGSEQDGKGDNYERPVMVIKSFNLFVCLIIPLTTSKKPNPFHFKIGIVNERESYVIISQIRLIDTKRLTNRICIIENKLFGLIRKTIRELF